MKKSQLLAGAVLFSLAGWSGAAAADQVYTLNPVVVTAQRMETTEIETPATETVVTAKKIEEAGYKNAFDIIESQVGLTSTGYGDGGQDFGFSSGRTVIRGYDRGTLVMVDGIPCFACPGFFVMIFTTPPIASLPYRVPAAPLMISTFSIISTGIPSREL